MDTQTCRPGSACGFAFATIALAALMMMTTAPLARAQAPAGPPPPQPLEEVVVSAPEPRYVAPNTRDSIGRIWAPVLINGKGPYRLVLDTGASRSAVTQRVVDDAGLPLRAKPVKLRGVTGAAIVAAVRADTLAFGDLVVENAIMPVVADAFGGACAIASALRARAAHRCPRGSRWCRSNTRRTAACAFR
jgi:hypothetical protein